MIKSVLCVLIMLTCSYLGFMYGERYRKRYYNLKELQRALLQLENEILFSYTSLPIAVDNISKKSKGEVKNFLKEVSENLSDNKFDTVYDAFSFSYERYKEKLYFNDDDINLIGDLSKSLGEVDIVGHEKLFSLVSESIKKNIEESEDSMKKNLKMYRYLGVCLGIGIVIIIL